MTAKKTTRARKAAASRAAAFTQAEREELTEISDAPGFAQACAVIRRRYLRDIDSLPRPRPSDLTAKYRTWRRWFQPGAPGPRIKRRPPLTALDVVRLALIEPSLRPWTEPRPSARAAAAFLALEVKPKPTVYPDFPGEAAAARVRQMFDRYGLRFTEYDRAAPESHTSIPRVMGVSLPEKPRQKRGRGQAARVLAVILRRDSLNLRHLLHAAMPRES